MFNVEKVGHRISELRKEKNMTQMELADKLGISYQAVSNWERGNSMPDIAKLPELAVIFEVTTDEILGESSELLKSAAKGELEKYVEQNKVTVEEFVEAAPALKPDQADTVAEGLTIEESVLDIKDIREILPYISEEVIDEIAWKYAEIWPAEDFSQMAKYVSEEMLDKIGAKMLRAGKDIGGFRVYMSEEGIDEAAQIAYGQKGIQGLMEVGVTNVSSEMLGEIARQEYRKNGLENFECFMRYMDEDDMAEIAKEECEKNGLKNLECLVQYLDEDDLAEIAKKEYEKNGLKSLECLVQYLDEDDLAEIAAMAVEKEGVKAIAPIARYLDEDALSDIIKNKYL